MDDDIKNITEAGISSDKSFCQSLPKHAIRQQYDPTDAATLLAARKVPSGPIDVNLYPQSAVLVHCGQCGGQVGTDRVGDHRKRCWKLHLYDGKSFRVHQVSN